MGKVMFSHASVILAMGVHPSGLHPGGACREAGYNPNPDLCTTPKTSLQDGGTHPTGMHTCSIIGS